MSVGEALHRLEELTGPDRVDEAIEDMVAAIAEYRLRHRGTSRLTEGEAEALATVGVDVARLEDSDDPGAYLAARRAAVMSDALTPAEAGERLGRDEERIRQRLRATPPTLVGMKANGGRWRLPAFQFAHRAAVAIRGGPVIAALPAGLSPQFIDAFFTRPNDVLRDERDEPVSPVAWIAEGRDLEPLIELAAVADVVP